jgi:hypothetical protein
MEEMHSHPVLITFCAILYYKRLVNKLDEVHSHDLIQLFKRNKSKEPKNKSEDGNMNKAGYNKKILNRWAVAITLINNLQLVADRKKSSSMRKIRV